MDYPTWLHELTNLGYKEDIVIEDSEERIVKCYFNEGKTPEDTLKLLLLIRKHRYQ
jgi:hypothetical protein